MQYKVIITNVSTHETKKGIINHSNIAAFAERLALYNWLLVEHLCNGFSEISTGEER